MEQRRRRKPKGANHMSGFTPDVPSSEGETALDEEIIAEPAQVREVRELPADRDEPVLDTRGISDELFSEEPEEEKREQAASSLASLIDTLSADVPEEESSDELPDDLPEEPSSESRLPVISEEEEAVAVEAVLERPLLAGTEIGAGAFSARLAGNNVLPLSYDETINEKSDIDSMAYPLSAFSDLQYGQMGVLRVSVRSMPDFKNQGRAWLAAARLGENPDEKKTVVSKVRAWGRYLVSKIVFDIQTMGNERARVEPPLPPHRRGEGLKPIPASQAAPEDKAAWKDAEAKARDQAHYETMIRSVVLGSPEDEENCRQLAETVISGLEMFDSEYGVQKMVWQETLPYDALLGLMPARSPEEPGAVLSAEELASIAHPPDDHMKLDGVRSERATFKTIPISSPLIVQDIGNLEKGIVPLGIQNPNSEDAQIVGMLNSDIDRHMLLVGKTGSGKSELMKWLVHGVAKSDYPIVLVDPHGQLCEDILKALLVNCPEREEDIVYCDLSDGQFPVAFNPLDIASPEMVEPTVGSVSQMLQVQLNLDTSSAPRATMFAKAALTALCEANLAIKDDQTKCTLLDVVPFFSDFEFRQLVVNFADNLSVRQNFDVDHGPFEQMSDKQQSELSMPVNRAFSTLAASESFSAVFSAGQNKLNLGELVQEGKIVLVQLARFSHQAQLGEFVGALIIPWLLSSMDSWGRHKDSLTGEEVGSGCRIFVDEAPRVFSADSSVPELLAEARKWDLGMIMAAQFIEQFPKQIIEASLNNTGSKIGLHCDPKAAGQIARAVAGATKTVTETDMATMPNFHFYGNVMLRGPDGVLAPSGPFSAKCLPMIPDDMTDEVKAARERVIERSRGLICNTIEEIKEAQRVRLSNVKARLSNELASRMAEVGESDFDAGDLDFEASDEGVDWAGDI